MRSKVKRPARKRNKGPKVTVLTEGPMNCYTYTRTYEKELAQSEADKRILLDATIELKAENLRLVQERNWAIGCAANDQAMLDALCRALEIGEGTYLEWVSICRNRESEIAALAKRNKDLEEQLDTLSLQVLALTSDRTMNMMGVEKWA